MFQRTNNTRKNKQTDIRRWGENEASRCCHESRFLVCFSLCISLRKKLQEVQMLLFQTSREITFYFQHFIQVCLYFLGTKNWRGTDPRSLPLLRHCRPTFTKGRAIGNEIFYWDGLSLFFGGGGWKHSGCTLAGCETATHTELDFNEAFITKAKPFVQSEQPKKLKVIDLVDKLKLILKH